METYLPAFEALIREGGAWSIMSAYNRYLNNPCSSNPLLLQEILREKWGFKGYVVSDCDAIASPSATVSSAPPLPSATTGFPQAIASTGAMPKRQPFR